MTTKKTKTVSHAKSSLPPPQVISEVHLIPLERIEIVAQVRTKFDAEAIRELTEDIEARGLLQPVIVNPVGDERYRLVCGERRVRAIRLLGQSSIPALITKMDEKSARLAQLAENIQREDLTLEEKARAVRWMFDESGSIAAVAAQVKRSKAWVSKHLSLSCPDFDWRARKLMQDGVTEDIELLNIVAHAGTVLSHYDVESMTGKITAGEMNRDQARDWLRVKKEELKKAQEAVKKEYESKTAKKPKEAKKEEFNLGRALIEIERRCMDEDASVDDILAKYTPVEIGRMEDTFFSAHEAGLKARASGNAVVSLAAAIEKHNRYATKLTAILRGYMDCPLNIRGIIADTIEANREEAA